MDSPVTVSGQYALVPLRLYETRVLTGNVASLGQLVAVNTAAAAPEPGSAPEQATSSTTEAKATRSSTRVRAGNVKQTAAKK